MLEIFMGIFGEIEEKWQSKKKKEQASDKMLPIVDITEQDILEDIHAKPLIQGKFDNKTVIFGKFSEQEIFELLNWSGVFEKIAKKGYKDARLELQFLSEMDQRIFIKWNNEVLVHIRLKISNFRFRFSPDIPTKKLLYIDWLMTRDPIRKQKIEKKLFQGQDAPGLGIFNEIADFIFNLSLGLGVKGAFNIPEYFHDALLFHRQFRFYDPQREAFFRALIRDLRHIKAKNITEALSNNQIYDQDNQIVQWTPGEMITIIDPEFSDFIWNQEYFMKVIRYLKRYKFSYSKN